MQQVCLCGEGSVFLQTATSTLKCPEKRQDFLQYTWKRKYYEGSDHIRKCEQQGRAGPTFQVLVRGKSRAVVTRDSGGLLGEGGFELTFCVVFHLE